MGFFAFAAGETSTLAASPRAGRCKTQNCSCRILQKVAEETMNRLARTMDLLLRTDMFVFKPICWKRAAVLHRYLTLSGINSRIVFGVRRGAQGEVDGHAWLESNGAPILETTAPNYKVTYAFPSDEPFEADLASMS